MSNVVLPGIREMFPEYLTENHSRPKNKVRAKTMQSLASRPSNSRSGNPGFPAIPALRHTSPRPSSSTVSHVSLSDPRQASSTAPSFPAQGPTLSMPNFDTPSTRKRSSSDSVFYSFDILRSDPSSLSLQHIASSATYPNRGAPPSSHNSRPSPGDGSTSAFRVAVAAIPYARKHSAAPPHERRGSTPSSANHPEPARMRIDSDSGPGCSSIISFPVFGSAVLRKNYSGDITDSDDDELSTSNSGKRHVCPTCFKRFNRPSSLKIHVNTHTGATPFRCPWPECGREFNVNSNMRRHYRNHTIPGSKAVDQRRRRRRLPSSGLVGSDVAPAVRVMPISSMDSPSISSRSGSEESDDDIPTPMDDCDRLHYVVEGPPKFSKAAEDDPASRYYSQSHIRTLGLEPEDRPSLSPSPSPDHVYSPSAPYVRSFTTSRVSTALRPVFHPLSFGDRLIKEEQMTETW